MRLLIHEIIVVGILVLMTGIRLLTGQWQLDLGIVWWWLGAMIGFVFVFFDRLVYALWQSPDELRAQQIKEIFKQGKWGQGIAVLLQETEGTEKLIIRSALFLGVWVVMGVFAFFSVANPFGRGFMFGLGLHLLMDLLKDYFGKGREMNMWFWQIKRPIDQKERQAIVWGFSILAVLIMLGL